MQSSSQANPSQVPKIIADFKSLDKASQIRLVNLSGKPAAERTSEERAWFSEIMDAIEEMAKMPITLLPPEYHETHRFANKMQLHMQDIADGNPPPEMEEYRHLNEARGIKRCLSNSPHYAVIQAEIDMLLAAVDYPGRFNVPAWLNAIAKQLGRPKPFLMIDVFTPSEADMIAQLFKIRLQDPELHLKILKLLLRASLLAQEPHPKRCYCLLCSHVASVAPADVSSSTASSSRRS